MRKFAVLTAILSIFIFSSLALAVPDPGEPDTAFVESKVLPLGTTEFTLAIDFYNDEELQAFDIGLIWDSPDIICDSVSFVGSRVDYINFKLSAIDTVAQQLHAGPVVMFEDLIPPGRGLGYTAFFSVDPGASAQVITFDSAQYPPAGDFVFTLGTGFNIEPQFVGGTVTIGTPSPPSISLSPASIETSGYTGATLPDDQIDVTNAGSGDLNWTATASSGWLSLDPASGMGNGTITLSYDLTGLAAGEYHDTVWVSDPAADNSPQYVPVMLTVIDPPCLTVSTNVINLEGFEGETVNAPLQITSCSSTPLEWTITGVDASWLSLSHTAGTDDLTVTVIANTTGVIPGSYSDVITVVATGADNSPQDITVNLTVNQYIEPTNDTVKVATVSAAAGDQAVVEITYENFSETGAFSLPLHYGGTVLICDSVSFVGSRFAYMSFNEVSIDNDAQMVLIGAAVVLEDPLPPGSGLLATMYFSIDPSAVDQFVPIDSGIYPPTGEFMFYDSVGVAKGAEFFSGGINIAGVPCFEFPTTEIVFNGSAGSPVPSVVLTPTNSCAGTLTWTLTDDAPWLTVTPSGTEGDDAVFEVNTAGLDPGTYTATATFESNGLDAPFEVTVILNLAGDPILGLSNDIFFLPVCRGELLTGSFHVLNLGTGEMTWTLAAPAEVVLEKTSGENVDTVDFSIDTAPLEYGMHAFTIIATSPEASNSPESLVVEIELVNCDDCSFDIAEVEIPQTFPMGIPISAYNVGQFVGMEFHIAFDETIISFDSVTSLVMTDPTLNVTGGEFHYVWVDINNPVWVSNGAPVMTLWFTGIGDIGEISPLTWLADNEVVDENGVPLVGLGYCEGSATIVEPVHDISGGIVYYDMVRPIEGVMVELTGDASAMVATDIDGEYLFADFLAGNYTVTPSRTTNDSGTSIADAIMIQRHLAYLEPFDTPYEMIAADVNVSDNVSVADAVLVEMYLAMLMDLPSGNWVFIDGSFAIDMFNWYDAPHSMDVVIDRDDVVLPDFIGIRMGDVNNTWSPVPLALKPNTADGVIALDVEDVSGVSGDLITVPITISSADEVAGLELHLGYDAEHLTAIKVESELISNFRSNPAADAVHLVWQDFASPLEITSNQTLATVTFRADERFTAATEISVTGAEVANSKGDVYTLNLSGGTVVANANSNPSLPTAYSLEQNTPNPFNPRTTIRATMKEAGHFTLTIFNITGEVIRTYSGSAEVGSIEFDWDGRTDNGAQAASGIYFYRFNAGDFVDTRKMMLLK